MKRYTHLLLDADGTFYDFASCENIALKKLFDYYHIPFCAENIQLFHEANLALWHAFERDEATTRDIRDKRLFPLLEKYGLGRETVSAGKFYCDCLSENGILFQGAMECLEALHEKYRLEMITNGLTEVQYGRFRSSGTESLYDHIIISEEIGVQKPKKEFFEYTLSTIGASPDECLIIGDSLTSDIQGGINSGIDTLYLHLSGEKKEGGYTYSAPSYDALMSLLL